MLRSRIGSVWLTLALVAGLISASGGLGPTAGAQETEPSCTEEAAASMPKGSGHNHSDITQHQFGCRMETVFFDSLKDELADQPNVILGEMDIESDIAAIAVAHPESGALFFDVSDPSKPRFLSWYRHSECEGVVIDVDCGAYIDLSEDGKVAFLSLQDTSVVPSNVPDPLVRPVSEPGVVVLDLRNPALPLPTMTYPVVSTGGVHTSVSHVVPNRGEFLFSVANGFGIEITRLERPGGVPLLVPVTRLDMDEVHDMFLQDDPLTGRTYLYVAAGFESGFYVYDVADPSSPQLLAEWDLTPQCPQDWYGHTIDAAVRNGHRFVTLTAEVFDFGGQTQGCVGKVGNGDKPGPMWIVDATDLSKLGPALDQGTDNTPALKAASEASLVTTWTNPAGRAGGQLTFSPHNQQIVGDLIYLSHYHGGVYVLDASEAFSGLPVRPREIAFVVPHEPETRPLYVPPVNPVSPFFVKFIGARPTVWDALFYKGYVLAPDWHGGLYSFRVADDPVAA